MVSCQTAVLALYGQNNEISLDELRKKLPKYKDSTLSNALSVARNSVLGTIEKKTVFTKVTEAEIEKVIIKKLNKSLDNTNIRLAIDFLKIKRADSGLDEDLDIEKYLKKFESNNYKKK